MAQLVLDDIPDDVLDQLRRYAGQSGLSESAAAVRLLTSALASGAPAAGKSSPLVEHNGLLLHVGKLAAGASWPDSQSEERVFELTRRTHEGGS